MLAQSAPRDAALADAGTAESATIYQGLTPQRMARIQRALQRDKLDGWLFFDFRRSDEIAYRLGWTLAGRARAAGTAWSRLRGSRASSSMRSSPVRSMAYLAAPRRTRRGGLGTASSVRCCAVSAGWRWTTRRATRFPRWRAWTEERWSWCARWERRSSPARTWSRSWRAC